MDDTLEPFSKLEAGFAEIEIERRPISVHVEATNRFGSTSDHLVKDLHFNYNIPDKLETGNLPCLQGMLSALQYDLHVGNSNNFAKETEILCFEHMNEKTTFTTLDSAGLDRILSSVPQEDVEDATSRDQSATENAGCHTNDSNTAKNSSPVRDPKAETVTDERLVVLFLSLLPKNGTSFASQAPIERASVQKLFTVLDVNPEYLLNLIGRPDYWSPRTRWRRSKKDELIGVGMIHFRDPRRSVVLMLTSLNRLLLSISSLERVGTRRASLTIRDTTAEDKVDRVHTLT